MSMNTNQIAEWLGGSREETSSNEPKLTTVIAQAMEDSADGTVKVVLCDDVISQEDADGNQIGTNIVEIPTSEHIEKGDQVIVTLSGDVMVKPIFTNVIGAGDRTYTIIALTQEAADAAATAAAEAFGAVEAIDQHFFDDSNGIHVATTAGDANTGPNLLANSLGILLRDGTLIRTAQTASGFAVYDGAGNTAGNIIALLGSVITLGKTGETQVILDNDAMEIITPDSGGNDLFFHVGMSDEAYDPTGQQVRQPFIVFGMSNNTSVGGYSVAFGISALASAFASAAFGMGQATAEFAFATGQGTASGAVSFAAGTGTATGHNSAAFGDETYAASDNEFACGQFNEIDTTGTTLFAVGDGGPNNRHNAFEVKNGGTAKLGGRPLLGYEILYENSAGSFTGNIILNVLISQYKKVEIYYKDTDGVIGSTSIWNPGTSFTVECSTGNYFTNGFSHKARTMKFMEQLSTTLVDTHPLTSPYWTGEFVIDGAGSHYLAGDYIGITQIIGYK